MPLPILELVSNEVQEESGSQAKPEGVPVCLVSDEKNNGDQFVGMKYQIQS